MTPPKSQTTPTKSPLSGAQPSCAACKYRRRRCSPDCPLAPHFPARKQMEFQNVHRLFGVNYVVNLLKKLPPHLHDDAAKSLIYEANLRAVDPVGGCYTAIRRLLTLVQTRNAELQIVLKKLEFHRARFLQNFDACDCDDDQNPSLD